MPGLDAPRPKWLVAASTLILLLSGCNGSQHGDSHAEQTHPANSVGTDTQQPSTGAAQHESANRSQPPATSDTHSKTTQPAATRQAPRVSTATSKATASSTHPHATATSKPALRPGHATTPRHPAADVQHGLSPADCTQDHWTRIHCRNNDNACISRQIDLMGRYERCRKAGLTEKQHH